VPGIIGIPTLRLGALFLAIGCESGLFVSVDFYFRDTDAAKALKPKRLLDAVYVRGSAAGRLMTTALMPICGALPAQSR
jgi:hypothetical protein